MPKALVTGAFCLGLSVLAASSAVAQPMSVPADRIIRPGDKIVWVAPSPHRLRVGGAGLTSVADVDKILTFSPELMSVPGDRREGESDVTVTGTVKDDAATSGVATFVFACGQHPVDMLSSPFTVEPKGSQPSRTLNIRAAPGLKWILKKDDGTEVQVDTTP